MASADAPPPRRGALVGATPDQARRPAGELLARIPWDGRRGDPRTTSAGRFLGQLLG